MNPFRSGTLMIFINLLGKTSPYDLAQKQTWESYNWELRSHTTHKDKKSIRLRRTSYTTALPDGNSSMPLT